MTCPTCGHPQLSEWPHHHRSVTQPSVTKRIAEVLADMFGPLPKTDWERTAGSALMLLHSQGLDVIEMRPPATDPALIDDGYLVEPLDPRVPDSPEAERIRYALDAVEAHRRPQGWTDDSDDMCPNCVTPWKCNGPHLADPDGWERLILPGHGRRLTVDELASSWRSCLLRLALVALLLILVGLAAGQLGRP